MIMVDFSAAINSILSLRLLVTDQTAAFDLSQTSHQQDGEVTIGDDNLKTEMLSFIVIILTYGQ